MAHIVTERCIGCVHTSCVEVCPVDCFKDDKEFKMLLIDPDICVDCQACVSECPEEAIFWDDECPEEYKKWININAGRAPDLPEITEVREPLKKICKCGNCDCGKN